MKLELRQADLADLAFLPPGSVDLAFSAWALNYVSDVSRVFRQVHRVLKTGAPFVFSLPHPAIRLIARSSDEPLLVRRSYWDRQPITWTWHDGIPLTEYQHTIADLYGGLQRANFAVDTILEPEPTHNRAAEHALARSEPPRAGHARDARPQGRALALLL